ncbi:hypothetical protein ACQY1Q_15080 [Tenacibaculum sp. TC6]|uniref:hypothetical protein n=1 Tax=Tenacibaculum sp. TC6 TaxID=3423223 RepID=UPI003D36467B
MHQKIVTLAFEKTKDRVKKEDGISLSKTKAAEYLSIFLKDEHGVIYGEKSLRQVYNGNIDISQPEVLKGICNFLGYNTYEDFLADYKKDNNPEIPTPELTIGKRGKGILEYLAKRSRWVYGAMTGIIMSIGISYFSIQHQQKMIKIEGTCEYSYFDKQGNPRVWYGKNAHGDLELFTSYGLHPETGKTLKPISNYMINKYICPK